MGRQVSGKVRSDRVVASVAKLVANLPRRSELAFVHVSNPLRAERIGELILRIAAPAGKRELAHVDEDRNFRGLQLAQEIVELGTLLADGEERFHGRGSHCVRVRCRIKSEATR